MKKQRVKSVYASVKQKHDDRLFKSFISKCNMRYKKNVGKLKTEEDGN